MNVAQHVLLLGIRAYRAFGSPLKAFLCGPLAQCRFTPSCSEYAAHAIGLHGAVRGGWFALKRLARCHPWGSCGEDPVPPIADHNSQVASFPDCTRRDLNLQPIRSAR